MSHRETVDMVASGYEWVCNECGHTNEEIGIPVMGNAIADLTCQGCGANYTLGRSDHHYNKL
jgi:transposase-like protein